MGDVVTGLAATPVVEAHERARAAGRPVFTAVLETVHPGGDGPLAGVPLAVKDNIDVAGVPTTCAYPGLTDPAARSATVVERLVAAGASVIAKTNLDQFATGLVGTRSPYGACHAVDSAEHVSGGSSSGSAVAVASGIVPLALGTDTAGSGRVPAAFNGLVGMKPTKGLVSTTGVVPACRSLDCVTTLTRTVGEAALALDVLAGFDPSDAYSRAAPVTPPSGIARRMRVIGVPAGPIDLDGQHRAAWQRALEHAATVASLMPVDVEPFLAAARLLYEGPWVAERLAAVGHLLEPDDPGLDPTVRAIILGGRKSDAVAAFEGQYRLAELSRLAEPTWLAIDALLLPVTPTHPRLDEVAADPVGVNSRLGTYTNMTNLLDLCAIAVPAGRRDDGLPFGVQLLGPAFADLPLLDLAARWCGEPAVHEVAPVGRTRVVIVGAHLTGQPLNGQLVGLGGRLAYRARTAGGYRMYRMPGPVPRPGLVHTGDGPAAGFPVEIWDLPQQGLGALVDSIAAPLGLGRVRLDDGDEVTGFVVAGAAADPAGDISGHDGWRAYLAASAPVASAVLAARSAI